MPGFLLPLIMGGSALLQYLGSRKQAGAAEKASEQQIAAAERAMAQMAPIYQQGRADLAPYAQGGQQGMTALTSLLGLPGAPAVAAPTAPGLSPLPGTARTPTAAGVYTGHQAVPRPGGPLSAGGSAYGGAGGMVLLRAPTGETRAVPADQVEYYLARGATRATPAGVGPVTPGQGRG